MREPTARRSAYAATTGDNTTAAKVPASTQFKAEVMGTLAPVSAGL